MVQEQILNYILDTKDSSLIILNRLDDSFFPNYKNEWSYINNHFNTEIAMALIAVAVFLLHIFKGEMWFKSSTNLNLIR